MLEIPFDSVRLYSGDDPNYELFLVMLTRRVSDTNRRESEKAKRKGRKRG